MPKKDIYYKDFAVIRYKPSEASSERIETLSQTALIDFFTQKDPERFFINVDCIQTNIKSKIGCGKPLFVYFFAKFDPQSPSKALVYDFKTFEEDAFLIRNNQERYCLKQVYKICYYV